MTTDTLKPEPSPPFEIPFLTIVMPLHEGAEWIGPTLESLAGNRTPDIEIIAIDSSPNSKTSDIAGSFSNRLPIQIVRRPDLAPWPTKTNLAIELARTEYVCMLHQDDVWLPGRIEAVRRWVRATPNASLHLAPARFIDRNGNDAGPWTCPLIAEQIIDPEALIARLLVQNFVSVPAPVIKRSAWLACGGMDETLWYTADWDIWLKLASAGVSVYHEDVTVGFRLHSNSLTVTGSRSKDDFEAQMATVLERHLDDLPNVRGSQIERKARASIEINVAMAAAASGNYKSAAKALTSLMRLAPGGLPAYLQASRLHERLSARVRTKLRRVF